MVLDGMTLAELAADPVISVGAPALMSQRADQPALIRFE